MGRNRARDPPSLSEARIIGRSKPCHHGQRRNPEHSYTADMPIKLPDDSRKEAIASIRSYARENLDEPMGELAAGFLLDFFLAEIGPSVYNQGVRDVQERLQARVMDIDVEVSEEEFPRSRRSR